ncbi:Fimbrial protein precursor [Photobacterium malacitanum]|uniref:Fimbrial protein n=1 Tax=Photobacterium malacitanum TaxID=2204294 RepID=A0A1Y6MJK7_9GAMM|nr:prepilin-type N-terminal cleavage/methylation domain-containing protein [Photobacterium malacitanum]SMY36736.1 Fimbrial protein precursor [Photobacterium malacitanum]
MKKQQGFTLIELMIVVAIIGVLSAVAIPAYKNYVTKSEVASAMATMKALITPLEAHTQDHGVETEITLVDIGTIDDANSLGTIGAPEFDSKDEGSFVFTFNKDSSSLPENSTITYQKTADTNGVWQCVHNIIGIEIKGCESTAPDPKN